MINLILIGKGGYFYSFINHTHTVTENRGAKRSIFSEYVEAKPQLKGK